MSSGRNPPRVDPRDATTLPLAAPREDAAAVTLDRPLPRGAGLAAGARFGDFEILTEISHGGMGIVYRARQISLQRLVALKVIRAGDFASADDVRRFHAEAEAAAGLEHPHIVPIYEVGECGGQHYFTMKLVEGGSLQSRLFEYRDDVPAGIRLLAQVTQAVHYAHLRGILHRDLKPANILLEPDGEPLVADFGLAKRVSDDRGLTISGAIVGTPNYMSPEQALGAKRVTVAVDIYALGAILYELLTGQPPFVGYSLTDVLHKVIQHDLQSPRRFAPRIDRDLETICLKALEKEPEKRYASAADFAADLERWLHHEPIAARPATLWERSAKWARRRPATAGLVAVSVVAVLALAVGGWLYNLRLQRALAKAEDSDRRTRAALDKFFANVSEHRLLRVPNMQPLRKELLQDLRQFYEDWLDRSKDDPAVQKELAWAGYRIARVVHETGTKEEALQAYERARDAADRLWLANPHSTDLRRELLKCEMAVATLNHELGRTERAIDDYQRIIAAQEELLRANATHAMQRSDLGQSYMNVGSYYLAVSRHDEARASLETAVGHFEALVQHGGVPSARADLASCLNNLSLVQGSTGKLELAIESLRQAIDLQRAVVAESPELPAPRAQLATLLLNLAGNDENCGRHEAAMTSWGEAFVIMEAVAREHSSVVSFQADFVLMARALGYGQRKSKQYDEARRTAQQALATQRQLVVHHENDVDLRFGLITLLEDLADCERESGHPADALPAYEEATELLRERIKAHLNTTQYREDLVRIYAQQVVTLIDAGQLDHARGLLFHFVQGEPLLASLRRRDDFRSVVRELEEKLNSAGNEP